MNGASSDCDFRAERFWKKQFPKPCVFGAPPYWNHAAAITARFTASGSAIARKKVFG